jgi:cold shock CspA family protein
MSDQECDSVSRYGDATYTGRVKWFNRVAGWGFISIIGGTEEGWKEFQDNEIFVHWKGLSVEKEQYRYLVNGEYVTFNVAYSESSDHKYQAQSVRGINGGMLMCETRNERSGEQERSGENQEQQFRQPIRVRPRGGGPREGQQGEQWFLVKRAGGQEGEQRRGRGGRGGRGQGRRGRWQGRSEQTSENESV